jgi:DNA-binding transcriptional ArsR family regulator
VATSPDALGVALTALADPSRRALLQRLAHGPATSGQLAELLPMSRPAASQHLRVLAAAGLMVTTVRGRHHWHELSTARLAEIEHWVRTLVDTWTAAPTLTTPPPAAAVQVSAAAVVAQETATASAAAAVPVLSRDSASTSEAST